VAGAGGNLDGIEFTIIRDVSTAHLAFVAGKLDWMATSMPLLKDVKSQAPEAICEVTPGGISRNLIINRDAPPFDNADMRRAIALGLDRKAFINIISEGQGDIGGVMQPLPEGVWGMPQDLLQTLPGYDPDVQKNRSEARQIMQRLGYGPDRRLALKVSTRNVPPFRDPAVILTDQLKEIFIDGELEIVETALWYPKMYRKDYKIGLNLTGGGVDDPDQHPTPPNHQWPLTAFDTHNGRSPVSAGTSLHAPSGSPPMSLAQLRREQCCHSEARELLAPVYGWFIEGFGTPDFKQAKPLLDEL